MVDGTPMDQMPVGKGRAHGLRSKAHLIENADCQDELPEPRLVC